MGSTDQAHGKTLVNQYIDILVLQNPIQISFRLTQTFKFNSNEHRFPSLALTLVEKPPKHCCL